LWQALLEGRDGISDVPNDRWNIDKYYDPDPNKFSKIRNKKSGLISDLKKFDADFLEITGF
jgi:acyl transferase domain-containing protein